MADFRDPVSYIRALAVLREIGGARALPSELVPLEQATGRISAAALSANELVPPFRNSAVDGFALRSEWTQGASPSNPRRIRVSAGTVSIAGDVPGAALSGGADACAIMTGAPFPPGLDASVKIEEFELVRGSLGQVTEILVTRPIDAEEYSRDAGEDFRPGDPFLKTGDRIGPEHLLAAATLGHAELKVLRRPRAVILSTGRELVDVRKTPAPGQIRNSTAPFLLAALTELGFETRFAGAVGDDPRDFENAMAQALRERPELIVTTGAVSMGAHDTVPDSLVRLGARVHFHRVAIRPGKPILFAEIAETAIFALPGNPVSSVIGARFFIGPYLRALQKRAPEAPLRAKLENDFHKPEGLRCFFKARLTSVPGRDLSVRILPGQPSFMIHPLLDSNAWAILEEPADAAQAGQELEVFPLDPQTHSWGVHASMRSQNPSGGCC